MATKQQQQGFYPEGYGRRTGVYKTMFCNHVKHDRECPYGEKCNYAHHFSELAPRIENELYKTVDCKIDQDGNCRFGKLCKFRHHNDFCVMVHPAGLYLLINRRSGVKQHVLIRPRKPSPDRTQPFPSGLFDLAAECSRELSDPAVIQWLYHVWQLPY
jgi:hypothetical protein